MDNPASYFDVKIQGRSLISRKTVGEGGSCAQVTGEAPVVEWCEWLFGVGTVTGPH